MPARLTVHFPHRPAKVLALPEERATVVGRDPECDLVVEDDRVSRRHARLAWSEAGWTVTDLGSKNGTSVDGVAFGRSALGERSWISFGGLLACFERLPGSAETGEVERQRRLHTSLDLQRRLDPAVGLPELIRRVVSSVLTLSSAERGFLLLVRADGDFEIAGQVGLSLEELGASEFGGSIGAVERALTSGEPVVASDAQEDTVLGVRRSIIRRGIRALLSVPVKALDRVVGVLYADSRQPGAAFTELDVEILAALASQAGLAIAVARLGSELKGLAERVAGDAAADPGVRSQLATEISEVWERSLPAVRQLEQGTLPGVSGFTSWIEAHRAALTEVGR